MQEFSAPQHLVEVYSISSYSSHPSSKPKPSESFLTQKNKIKLLLYLIFFVCIFSLVFFVFYFVFFAPKVSKLDSIYVAQPFVENSDFHSFTLPNRLKVVVMNPNNGARSAYVALTVGVGSESDPPEFIGFTHLIEHLLFTGSKKFPEDNYIEKVVNKYHGENNGVTKAFTTSYYYRIDQDGLDEFSEVLVDAVNQPLFAVDTIRKEMNNVNSEISMRMTYNKNLAYYKLIKTIGNKKSKMFSDGFANIDPASIDYEALQRQILDFHEKYYSANIMTLAVITSRDPAEVRKIVTEKFGILPDKGVKRPLFNETAAYNPPFAPEVMGSVHYLKAFNPPGKFSMVFTLPSGRANTRFFPLEYFSILLNHFAENSIKQQLIKENLVSNFYDEIALQDYRDALYIVSFELTAQGQKRISAIMNRFFDFISFAKSLPKKRETYLMLAKIAKFGFMFNVGSKFTSTTSALGDYFSRVLDFSETIQDFPAEKILTLSNIQYEYRDEEFHRVLDRISPSNAVFIIESDQFKVTQKVRKFGSKSARNLQLRSENSELEKRVRSLETLSSQLQELDQKIETLDLKAGPQSGRARKLLVEQAGKLSESAFQTTFLDTYFDKSIETVELPFALNFDNGRRYFSQNIPPYLLKELGARSRSGRSFDVLEPFSTAYLDEYPIITECPCPMSLSADSSSPDGQTNKIQTKKLFELVFGDKQSEESRELGIQELRNYKMCLMADVLQDDQFTEANILLDTPTMVVHHKLYRKTFQPKYIISIEIEMEYLIDSVVKAEFQAKVENMFAVEIFCVYVQKHMELKINQEFMKGNTFGCRLSNYHLVFEFSGISTDLIHFALKVLEYMSSLKNSDNYQLNLIHNLKERVINRYSEFETMTSIKLATYYLNLLTDKLFIDYSTSDKFIHLRDKINSVGAATMASVVNEIGKHTRLNILFVGNVEEIKAISYSSRIKDLIISKFQTRGLKTESFATYRQYIMKNLIFRIPPQKHFVVRATNIDPAETNNVYLSYFQIEGTDRMTKVYALIMIHFLRSKVFDVLRNKLNLGYVAHAGLKANYHNLGMMVLVQGESFRPHDIEGDVDDTLASFLKEIKGMKKSDFDSILRKTVRQLEYFPSDLDAVSDKLFMDMEEVLTDGKPESYISIYRKMTKEGLYEFIDGFMRKNFRRLTIELFANQVTPEEKDYRQIPDFNLNRKPYTLTDIETLVAKKFSQKANL